MIETIKADLHTHLSTFRPKYGKMDILENLDKRGFDSCIVGVTGMSHVDDDRCTPLVEDLCSRGNDITELGGVAYLFSDGKKIFIRTLEIPTKYGHILALGVTKEVRVKQGRTIEDSVKELQDQAEYHPPIVAAHPFSFDGVGMYLLENPETIPMFDAVEVYNGSSGTPFVNGCFFPSTANNMAQSFYNRHCWDLGIGAINSSDGHSKKEILSSYTEIECLDLSSGESLIKSLRENIHWSEGIGNRKSSHKGALDHAVKMAGVIGLNKIGIKI